MSYVIIRPTSLCTRPLAMKFLSSALRLSCSPRCILVLGTFSRSTWFSEMTMRLTHTMVPWTRLHLMSATTTNTMTSQPFLGPDFHCCAKLLRNSTMKSHVRVCCFAVFFHRKHFHPPPFFSSNKLLTVRVSWTIIITRSWFLERRHVQLRDEWQCYTFQPRQETFEEEVNLATVAAHCTLCNPVTCTPVGVHDSWWLEREGIFLWLFYQRVAMNTND